METSAESGAFRWPGNYRAALSLSFDDARPSQAQNGVPVLNRHGAKATFYLGFARMKENPAEWKDVLAAGHEFGNHTLSHPCSGNFAWSRHKALEQYTIEKIRDDVHEANREIQNMFGITPVSFAYPCGHTFVGRGEAYQSYIPFIAKTFKSGRGFMGQGSNDPLYCDMAHLECMRIDGLSSAEAMSLVHETIDHGGWLIFGGHEILPGELGKVVDDICSFACNPSNGIWIDTVGAVAEYVASHRTEDFKAA